MAHFETGGLSLTIVYLQMAGDSRVFETHGHLSYLPNSSIRSADKQLTHNGSSAAAANNNNNNFFFLLFIWLFKN